MGLLSVIRRWYHREQFSLREIAKRTGLSRNTVRRYLRGELLEPSYCKRSRSSQLDQFHELLTTWLQAESNQARKRRRTVKQLHRELSAQGFSGSYDRVAAFARRFRQAQREEQGGASRKTYIPLFFAPGEAFQFDWSEESAVIAGVLSTVQVAHVKLSYSRAFLLRAYWQQSHEMLFDAHACAFSLFGGIPAKGIYDNMKTAVDQVKRGKARVVNTRFAAMTNYYVFEAVFCNPAAGWEKGQVEKQVRDVRAQLWQQLPAFDSLAALNEWLTQKCLAAWETLDHPQQPIKLAQAFRAEQPYLMPMTKPFDGFVEHLKRVSPTCLVTFAGHRYSVPACYANRCITLRAYAHHLVFVANGQIMAQHERCRALVPGQLGQTCYQWQHYLSVLQHKPGALRNGAPFTEMPAGFQRLQAQLLKRPGGDRDMVDILSLVLLHDEAAVLIAVELALEAQAYSKQAVLNFLSRLMEAPIPEPISPPGALTLQVEPQANAARYDQLRQQEVNDASD